MGKNMGALVGVAVFMLVFSLAPNIVWVIIGAEEIDNKCNNYDDSPTLAAWLVVEGSVGIFVNLVSLPLIFLGKHEITGAFFGLSSVFFLAWNIIGAYRLSQDSACEFFDDRLYDTTLAAVIIGFVSLFFSLIQAAGSVKGNDDDN